MDNDSSRYLELQEQQAKAWEEACVGCGACCGTVDGDPCEFLTEQRKGKYFCRIYKNRFGLHRTLGGREFQCVPLRQILHKTWPGDGNCAYKKKRE